MNCWSGLEKNFSRVHSLNNPDQTEQATQDHSVTLSRPQDAAMNIHLRPCTVHTPTYYITPVLYCVFLLVNAGNMVFYSPGVIRSKKEVYQ